MVNKLDDIYECPVDTLLFRFIDNHLHWYRALCMTPNMVTTLALISGLYSAYLIWQRQFGKASVMFGLSYYFDCVDGKLARRYNMTTKYGDVYDHVSDLVKFFAVCLALFHNSGRRFTAKQYLFQVIIGFLLFCMILQLGYQEAVSENTSGGVLSVFEALVSLDKNPHDTIQVTKYFGNGTFILALLVIVWIWQK